MRDYLCAIEVEGVVEIKRYDRVQLRARGNGVGKPKLLLADEPTGNLDPVTASYVFEALEALVRQSGLAALIATHNHELASRMDRRVTLAEGKVVPL